VNDNVPENVDKDWWQQRQQAPAVPTEGEVLLCAGDRIPDFVLPDPQGELRYFYQLVTGAPAVLVLAANTAQQDQWDEIKGFAAAMPALREAGVQLFIVSNDGVDSLSMVAKIIPEHAIWFADIKGVVHLGLRGGAVFPFTGVACMLLDGNQRAIAVREPASGQADWVLAMLKSQPASAGQRLGATAPILLLPGVLEGEDCAQLRRQIQESGPTHGTAPIADPALAQRIGKLLLRRIGPEVEKVFGIDDFVIESAMLRWDAAEPAATLDRKREIDDPAVQGRSFFLILDLAEDAYEGGEIRFPEYAAHSYRPGSGGAIVFSGTLLRELAPTGKGRRELLTATLRRQPPVST
jgi:hypothetical protein